MQQTGSTVRRPIHSAGAVMQPLLHAKSTLILLPLLYASPTLSKAGHTTMLLVLDAASSRQSL
jgi:hypothetical protein